MMGVTHSKGDLFQKGNTSVQDCLLLADPDQGSLKNKRYHHLRIKIRFGEEKKKGRRRLFYHQGGKHG